MNFYKIIYYTFSIIKCIMKQTKKKRRKTMSPLLETFMLVCFGLSWPINVMKAIKARSAKSMSLPFILLIISGYIAGISAKLLSHQVNYVLVVYFINLAIVTVNLLVYFRNRHLDHESETETSAPVHSLA